MVPVVLGVVLIAFLTIQLVPGDPVRIMLHGRATEEVIAAAHARLGLDQPVPVQFARFVWNALHGDLGTWIIQQAPVTSIIVERLGASLFLLDLQRADRGPVRGAARSRRRPPRLPDDHVIRVGGMVGFAMPPFWMGLLLMLLFGLRLGWFPIAGYGRGFLGPRRAPDAAAPDHRAVPCAHPDPVAARLHARGA